jgi:hypothetical protein
MTLSIWTRILYGDSSDCLHIGLETHIQGNLQIFGMRDETLIALLTDAGLQKHIIFTDNHIFNKMHGQ